MIHPVGPVNPSSSDDVHYQIVAWGHTLPSFDPLLMVKTVILTPNSVQKFNHFLLKFNYLIEQSVIAAIALRFATFAVPACMGRVIAPISAILHIPGMMVFASGMRFEYVKIIVQTFDFWFIQTANTLWAITLCVIVSDTRVVLVIICWVNFTNSMFQETHLRNTTFIVTVSLWEWIFYMVLMAWLSLGLVDEVHHYALIIARGRTLSTKDVLANVIGTMTTLSLRNLYRRYRHAIHQKNSPGTPTQALGYRCKIALSVMGSLYSSSSNIVVPYGAKTSETIKPKSGSTKATTRPPLQMNLVTEFDRIDAKITIWPRIGALTPVSTWKIIGLYSCGAVGASFAAFSLFWPANCQSADVIAVSAVVTSTLFSGIYACCWQRQLLRSIVTSFHYLFLVFQLVAVGVCVIDMLSWQWVPACGVICSLVLAQTILTVDALTPIMKQRLKFTYWMVVGGIVLFWLVHAVLLLDVLVLGRFNLKDRVFLEFVILGQHSQFHVVPFLLSRVITVLVWSARYVFVALTRHNDNALVLLRGNVEFDYESWKKQVKRAGISTKK